MTNSTHWLVRVGGVNGSIVTKIIDEQVMTKTYSGLQKLRSLHSPDFLFFSRRNPNAGMTLPHSLIIFFYPFKNANAKNIYGNRSSCATADI
jgi:hypothetical protein